MSLLDGPACYCEALNPFFFLAFDSLCILVLFLHDRYIQKLGDCLFFFTYLEKALLCEMNTYFNLIHQSGNHNYSLLKTHLLFQILYFYFGCLFFLSCTIPQFIPLSVYILWILNRMEYIAMLWYSFIVRILQNFGFSEKGVILE